MFVKSEFYLEVVMREWRLFLKDKSLNNRLRESVLCLAEGRGKFADRIANVWDSYLFPLQSTDFPEEIVNRWDTIESVINEFLEPLSGPLEGQTHRMRWDNLSRSSQKKKILVNAIFELFEESSGIGEHSQEYLDHAQ